MMQYRMILVSVEFQGRKLSDDFWHSDGVHIFVIVYIVAKIFIIFIRLSFVYIILNLTYTIVKLLVSENLIILMYPIPHTRK